MSAAQPDWSTYQAVKLWIEIVTCRPPSHHLTSKRLSRVEEMVAFCASCSKKQLSRVVKLWISLRSIANLISLRFTGLLGLLFHLFLFQIFTRKPVDKFLDVLGVTMREAEMDRRDLIILPCRRVAMTPSPFTSISPIILLSVTCKRPRPRSSKKSPTPTWNECKRKSLSYWSRVCCAEMFAVKDLRETLKHLALWPTRNRPSCFEIQHPKILPFCIHFSCFQPVISMSCNAIIIWPFDCIITSMFPLFHPCFFTLSRCFPARHPTSSVNLGFTCCKTSFSSVEETVPSPFLSLAKGGASLAMLKGFTAGPKNLFFKDKLVSSVSWILEYLCCLIL